MSESEKDRLPPGFHAIDDVIAEHERDPERKAALDAARVRLRERYKTQGEGGAVSETPRTEYLAMRLKKSSVEVSDHDLGVQMRIAASELNNLERDLAEAVRLLEELLADCDADLKPTKKHPARVFLTSLKERT